MKTDHRTITDRFFRRLVAFLSGYSVLLVVTFGLEWYVLQPTSQATVAAFVMVQLAGAWLAIAGLASAMIISVLLFRRMSAGQLAAVPSATTRKEQWVPETQTDWRERVWTFGRPSLQEAIPRGPHGAWKDVPDMLTPPAEAGNHSSTVKEKELCECVGK